MTVVPQNISTTKVTVSFKLAPEDVGKPDILKIDDNLLIRHISKNSFYNGLIMSDKVLKVNDVSGNAAKCTAELMKGGKCNVEVMRRNGVTPLTSEKIFPANQAPKKGHAYFILTLEKPAKQNATGVGVQIIVVKKRGIVSQVEFNTMGFSWFGRGDSIVSINGNAIPTTGDPDVWMREQITKVLTGNKLTLLIERPVEANVALDFKRYLDSIAPVMITTHMASDVRNIAREASNMHTIVLRKIKAPSILASDIKKPKKSADKTNETREISISTASTEMKICSDVEDDDDLRPVVNKSHAAGSSSDDDAGCFDDE
uniref:PDZ domain-containing protein n=1 Tax=Caenorhabditis tropicalis TaxID=1561998 RepID=A0A1I7T0U8_9PELO